MLTTSEADAAARERLSALVDGELEPEAVGQVCARWRESAESRATWHAYQLIGDVLRSDDLAGGAARDAEFMSTLRARLATEPVVLAPQPIERPAPEDRTVTAHAVGGHSRRWSWMAPTAVAAGFVAVAGVLTLTRTTGVLPDQPAGTSLAQTAPAGAAAVVATAVPVGPSALSGEPQTFVANGQLIRDARLDRYLAAHKQFAGSTALGVPSGFLRNATVEAVGR